jgi:hypothetical protein
MGTFENPDLRASAARIACLNHFASIAALRKKAGFDQPDRVLKNVASDGRTRRERAKWVSQGWAAFLCCPTRKKRSLLVACRFAIPHFESLSNVVMPSAVVFQHAAKSYLTPKPRLLVYTSTLCGAANIFFEPPLRGLFAFLFARVAHDSVRTASIPQYQPRPQLAGLCCNRKLDADCPPVVSGHSGSVFLRGTSRQTLNF